MLAQAQWAAANLPLEPEPTDPELAQAFYRLWQQHWFMSRFQNTGIMPDKVFPITTDQQELLATATAVHFEQITGLVNDFGQHSFQHWLMFNQSLPANFRSPVASNCAVVNIPEATGHVTDLPKGSGKVTELPVSPARKHPLATKLLKTAGIVLLAPVALTHKLTRLCASSISPHSSGRSSKQPLDRKTDYEQQPPKQWQLTKHFNSDQHPAQYRLECKDLCVLPNGDIVLKDFPAMEVNADMAAKIPGSYQVEGKITLTPVNGLCSLPGLVPDEDIVEMHTVPSVKFRLKRDQYSGLHRVCVPAGNRSITFTYTVQARESGCQSPSQPLQPDAYCSMPMKQAIETLFAHMSEYPQHQRQQLLAIKEATTTEQRIDAISHYCQQFSGHAKPAARQPLLLYLLQQRQGSCRHRVVAFVGLCRYFAIPSRIIQNTSHAFVEVSLNQTWHSRDLGGAPCDSQIAAPQFSTPNVPAPLTQQVAAPPFSPRQPRENGQPNQTELTKNEEILFSVFNQASSEEQMYLAKVIKVDTETLRQSVRKRTPLTQANIRTATVISELWSKATLIGLSLGLTLLKVKGELDDNDRCLIGKMESNFYSICPLVLALKKLISTDVDTARLIQLLADLYKTVIVNGSTHPIIWHNALVGALIYTDLTKPAAAALAREAFESGWILLKHKTPVPEDASLINGCHLLRLLNHLGKSERLKALSDDCLKWWYKHFMRPRGGMSWWQEMKENTIISHSVSGHSSQLDSWLTVSSLNSTWSDEPEGIPEVGRLLAQVPAYRQTKSAQSHRRPVIIIDIPCLNSPALERRAEKLLLEKLANDPSEQSYKLALSLFEEELCAELEQKLSAAESLLKEQFCQYFFQKTTANGNQLHLCWAGGKVGKSEIDCGSHQPSSPQELFAMFTCTNDKNDDCQELRHALIKQALNMNNALILDIRDMEAIFIEYLINTDLKLISDHWPLSIGPAIT